MYWQLSPFDKMTRIHFLFCVVDVWAAECYNEANDAPNQRPMAVAWLLAGPGGEATLSAGTRLGLTRINT